LINYKKLLKIIILIIINYSNQISSNVINSHKIININFLFFHNLSIIFINLFLNKNEIVIKLILIKYLIKNFIYFLMKIKHLEEKKKFILIYIK